MTPDGTSLYITAGAPGHGSRPAVRRGGERRGDAQGDPRPSSAGKKPTAIAIDPAGETLYVADQGTDDLLPVPHRRRAARSSRSRRPHAARAADRAHRGSRREARLPDRRRLRQVDGRRRGRRARRRPRSSGTRHGRDPHGRRAHTGRQPSVRVERRRRHLRLRGRAPTARSAALDPPRPRPARRSASLAISADGKSLYAAAAAGSRAATASSSTRSRTDGALDRRRTRRASRSAQARTTSRSRRTGAACTWPPATWRSSTSTRPGSPPRRLPRAVDLVEGERRRREPEPGARRPLRGGRARPAGSAVAFDAAGASDPDGSITRYDWDFGDGNTLPNGGPQVAHVYAQPGAYEVQARGDRQRGRLDAHDLHRHVGARQRLARRRDLARHPGGRAGAAAAAPRSGRLNRPARSSARP